MCARGKAVNRFALFALTGFEPVTIKCKSYHYHITFFFYAFMINLFCNLCGIDSAAHTCKTEYWACAPTGQFSYCHLIMEVPAQTKCFHLLWPEKILWLINNKIDCARCSPRGQKRDPVVPFPRKYCKRLANRCKMKKMAVTQAAVRRHQWILFLMFSKQLSHTC